MSARFKVETTFTINSRSFYVLVGNILDGVIQKGMKALLPLNNRTSMHMTIDAVEFIDPGGKVGLCISYSNDDELGLLDALNIGDEEIEVIH